MVKLLALLVALFSSPVPAGAQAVRVVTEELPPFSMTRDGQLMGLSTQVVRAALKEAGIDAPMQSMPWARAYDLALNTENILIYSLTRTPEREKLFKWVGVVAPTRWYLFGLAEKQLKPSGLDDARKYQIGTVNEDIGEQFLKSKGFALGKNLQSSNAHESVYAKLKLGRVDFWISDDVSAYYIVRTRGDDPAKVLVKSLALPELDGNEGGMEMAFSLKTPDATVQRLRDALAAIQARGIYAQLLNDWR